MNSILKILALFLVFGIISACNLSLFEKDKVCPDDSKNLGNSLKFGEYISMDTARHETSIVDEGNRPLYVSVKEKLFLHEDSTISYFAIANNAEGDTIKKLSNGSFKVYQDSAYPWFILELEGDSIFEKIKMGKTQFNYAPDSFKYANSFEVKFFEQNTILQEANIFSDIDNESNCFSLAYKVNPLRDNYCDPDWSICCDKMILIERKTFCLKQPEEIENEQNLTGDEL